MFFRILKKELQRKKGINVILFLFILLAVIFVASSVNCILVVANATEYCMDNGKVPISSVWTYNTDSIKGIHDWIEEEGIKYLDSYSEDRAVTLPVNNITSIAGDEGKTFKTNNSILIQNQWKEHMLIFDAEGDTPKIEDGTLAMQEKEMKPNGLKAGDEITITYGKYVQSYTLTEAIQDPAVGGEYIGITRFFISDNDYKELVEEGGAEAAVFNIETKTAEKFSSELNQQEFDIMVQLDRSMIKKTYLMSMISAGILTILGVALIIIAFLILRFTILVTMQEDYHEIGIMKALGIRDKGIKKIYLVKYAVMTSAASALGCVLSIFSGRALLDMIAGNMMMENGNSRFYVNILCAILVFFAVIGFCYASTNRVKKFTAINAIRGANDGRFRKKAVFALYHHRKSGVPSFLAYNDIFSALRKYIVMILTFMIGTVIIMLCSNTIATFQSDEMAKNFLLDTGSDVYIPADSVNQEGMYAQNEADIEAVIADLKQRLQDQGYDTDIHSLIFYSVTLQSEKDDAEKQNYMSIKPIGSNGDYVQLTGGSIPKLENEIVVSEKIMEKKKLTVGDSVNLTIDGKDYRMIISGSFQNYMHMGESILLSAGLDLEKALSNGGWYYQVKVNHNEDQNLLEELQKDFPEYKWQDVSGVMQSQMGDTMAQVGTIKNGILILMCALNMLITVLMMKIFIAGEAGQIAMLRSIGFSVRAVRCWQVIRMGIVLLLGVVSGILLSIPLNNVTIKPIFGMMGATKIKIQFNIPETYILYPLILLGCVLLAAYLGSASIKKMNLMEINNID